MNHSIQTKQESMTHSKDQATPAQEKDTFPLQCGPGCSCGAPSKSSPWKIIIMLIVIALVLIAMIYRRVS